MNLTPTCSRRVFIIPLLISVSMSLSLLDEPASSVSVSKSSLKSTVIITRICLQFCERKQLFHKHQMICASLPLSFLSLFYLNILYRLLSDLLTRIFAQALCGKFITQVEKLKACDKSISYSDFM